MQEWVLPGVVVLLAFFTQQISNSADGDFRLQPGTPCMEAGDPDVQYNDPDGSRCDMGAYPLGAGSSR